MGKDIDRFFGRSLSGYRTAGVATKIRAGPNLAKQSERGWGCRLRVHAGHYTFSLGEAPPAIALAKGLSVLPSVIAGPSAALRINSAKQFNEGKRDCFGPAYLAMTFDRPWSGFG